MDIESLRVFLKVAELANLTRAAEQLGLAKSQVSRRIRRLEEDLGGNPFHRTSRSVRLSVEGEALLPRARDLVREADEIAAMFRSGQRLRGALRIDLPMKLAHAVIFPRLPEFLRRHPELQVFVSTTDHTVDPVREGFDCVLRVGESSDSDLIQRRIGELTMCNVASRAYLDRHGTPRSLGDLPAHQLIHYDPSGFSTHGEFDYLVDGAIASVRMRASVTVNNTDAYEAACLAGLGIIQLPRVGAREKLTTGELVEVLPEHGLPPMPVVLLHPHGRRPPARVRAVLKWLETIVQPHLA